MVGECSIYARLPHRQPRPEADPAHRQASVSAVETTTPRDLIRALRAAGWRRMPIKHLPAVRDLDGAPYDSGAYEFTWDRGDERIGACWDIDSARLIGQLAYWPNRWANPGSLASIDMDYLDEVGLSRLAVVMLVLGITGAQR